MKSEKGLIRLLILCEAIILALTIAFGVLKQAKKEDDEPTQITVNSEENAIDPLSETTETLIDDTEELGDDVVVELAVEDFSEEVDAILEDMSVEAKVAQLFLVSPETLTNTEVVTNAGEDIRNALAEYPVGGILYGEQNYRSSGQIESLVRWTQQYSEWETGLYLFISTYAEDDSGAVIAVSNDNSAEAVIQVLDEDGDLSVLPEENVLAIPYLQQIEEMAEAVEDDELRCFALKADLSVDEKSKVAIAALQNGADMLCVTADFADVYAGVLEAVNDGTISIERIEQAAGRIITRKLTIEADSVMEDNIED